MITSTIYIHIKCIYRLLVHLPNHLFSFFFFFNDPATTEIYTLSLHDALPIFSRAGSPHGRPRRRRPRRARSVPGRSEEHTSELQSQFHLVCRLLLEKKKKKTHNKIPHYMKDKFLM